MSTIKLDLKQFKHIKSDDNTTTLQHKSGGHTLTIKHSSLGPEAKAQLSALAGVSQSAQTHANSDELKHKGLAEGGNVSQPYAPPMKGPSRGGDKVKLDLPKKEPMGKVIMKAEGGEVDDHECEGKTFCMHCGGQMPKMYAEGTKDHLISADGDLGMMEDPRETEPPAPSGQDAPDNPVNKALRSAGITPAPDTGPTTPSDNGAIQAPAAMQPMDASSPEPATDSPEASSAGSPDLTGAEPPPPPDHDQSQDFAGLKDNHLQGIAQEHTNFNNDLENGHITPKTIAGLMFDGKGTVGKISAAFGMLLSGMGSGLTGQPNALLGIMQKQIDNDLTAQQNSKSNAQNLYKLGMQHDMQTAQIANMAKTGALTEAQAKMLGTENATKVYALTQMRMNSAALHEMVKEARKHPNDPRAQQALQYVSQAVQTDNFNLADRAASIGALVDMHTNGNQSPESQFQAQQLVRRQIGQGAMADAAEDRHLPNVPGQSTSRMDKSDKDQLQSMNLVNMKGKEILDSIKKHSALGLTLSTKDKQDLAQKMDEFKSFYGTGLKVSPTEGARSWFDEQMDKDPGSIVSQVMNKPARIEEAINSNNQRLDRKLSGTGGLGFPAGAYKSFIGQSAPSQAGASQPKGTPGNPAKDKNGVMRPTVIINGKAYFTK